MLSKLSNRLPRPLVHADTAVLLWQRRYSVMLLRLAVGIVYIWFGALKLFPGVSPAEPLIRGAYAFLPAELLSLFVVFIGVFEIGIGVLFMYGRLPRITTVLMLMQMGGAISPLVLAPQLVWVTFPHVWTLEGQYIFKDIILISAALVINAATAHRLPNAPRNNDRFRNTSEIPVENLM